MTPEQAKTKWCPMVRALTNVGSCNVDEDGWHPENRNPPYARCIGPECALWRRFRGAGFSIDEGQCGLIVHHPPSDD